MRRCGERILKGQGRALTCFTTVTVPGAMATTEATAVASWASVPSSMICWRMFTAVGSRRSPYKEEANRTPVSPPVLGGPECKTRPYERPLCSGAHPGEAQILCHPRFDSRIICVVLSGFKALSRRTSQKPKQSCEEMTL